MNSWSVPYSKKFWMEKIFALFNCVPRLQKLQLLKKFLFDTCRKLNESDDMKMYEDGDVLLLLLLTFHIPYYTCQMLLVLLVYLGTLLILQYPLCGVCWCIVMLPPMSLLEFWTAVVVILGAYWWNPWYPRYKMESGIHKVWESTPYNRRCSPSWYYSKTKWVYLHY